MLDSNICFLFAFGELGFASVRVSCFAFIVKIVYRLYT
jgi:hypothetical protein